MQILKKSVKKENINRNSYFFFTCQDCFVIMFFMKKAFLYTLAALFVIIVIPLVSLFAAFFYVESKFNNIKPISRVHETETYKGTSYHNVVFLHQVNTLKRAKIKENTFKGFEFDIMVLDDGKIIVAHDDIKKKFGYWTNLEDIFSALESPDDNLFWMDLKSDLSEDNINEILALADKFNIPRANFFFEIGGGAGEETAKKLKKQSLLLIYQVPHEMDKDGGDPAKREAVNNEMQRIIDEYEPFALAGSIGKYHYLKTYFPNMKKAIHYSTTKRPSAKKLFMERKMLKDPKVELYMIDEYTYLPF